MNVTDYLQRIDYRGTLEPTASTLHALHVAHLRHVPFKNLDIACCRLFDLGPVRLFDKIVTRQRGGFCYELNGLYALLLEQLGFAVTRLAARINVCLTADLARIQLYAAANLHQSNSRWPYHLE